MAMTEKEFREKAEYNGYTEQEIKDLIEAFRTDNEKDGLEPIPFEEIPLFYKHY